LYIAAVLKKDYCVKVYDPYPSESVEAIVQQIDDFGPDIVGLSVLTSYKYRAKDIIRGIRDRLRDVKLVIGGPHPTALPQESLDYFDVDFAVRGEGEETMKELCDAVIHGRDVEDVKGITYKQGKRIIQNEARPLIQNLDDVPFPAREFLDFEKYLFPPGIIRGQWSERSTTLISSRGCPFRCIWCGTRNVFGKSVRRRTVRNTIEEIEHLIDRYRIDTIWFVDDTFTLSSSWVQEFTAEIIRRRIKFRWGCQSRADTLTEEMARGMRKAGCIQLDFGIESGSKKVLRVIKKDIDLQRVKETFAMTRRLGFQRLATFMIGNPEETLSDIEESYCFAKEIRPDFVSCFYATPFPGTELMAMAQRGDWIKDPDYSTSGLKSSPMMLIDLDANTLRKLRARMEARFMFGSHLRFLVNPNHLCKILALVLRYPTGIVQAFAVFARTMSVNDSAFRFLLHYAAARQRSWRKHE
jgi:radical SAM superfamily enzyme YgiQ (UPF0313 family)